MYQSSKLVTFTAHKDMGPKFSKENSRCPGISGLANSLIQLRVGLRPKAYTAQSWTPS